MASFFVLFHLKNVYVKFKTLLQLKLTNALGGFKKFY